MPEATTSMIMDPLAPMLSPDVYDAVEAAVEGLPEGVARRLVDAIVLLAEAADK